MPLIYGWDASHYDAVPDADRVVAEGFQFMTHKAGGDADDAELAAWWKELKKRRADILLGAYWVLTPGSGAAKADKFLARLDSQCAGWRDGPFILQVDCEEWRSDPDTIPSKADIRAFCQRLDYKMPKLTPIVYAPKWVYGDTLTGLGYPLWASAYVNGSGAASALYPGDTSSRWNKYSGQVPAILQFTSSATIAGQTTCDANAFRGSRAGLIKLLAPGWVPQPEEDPMAGITAEDIAKQALTAPRPYTGGPGDRIEERGWGETNPWMVLQYLFEMVAADAVTLADGTTASGSVLARLARIEEKLGITAPPTPPAA